MSLPLAPFLTVWALLAVNVASPGPNVLNTITTAMGSGRRAAIGSAAGVGIGIGCWCLAMTLGTAALFQAAPVTRTIMTVVAVALLAWFAARYFANAWAGWSRRAPRAPTQAGLSLRASFLRSLSVNALNPKALTTWVVILSLFPVARAGASDIAFLCAGAMGLAFAIHALYALAFSTAPAARVWFRLAPPINAAVGLFFSAFALRLALSLLA